MLRRSAEPCSLGGCCAEWRRWEREKRLGQLSWGEVGKAGRAGRETDSRGRVPCRIYT